MKNELGAERSLTNPLVTLMTCSVLAACGGGGSEMQAGTNGSATGGSPSVATGTTGSGTTGSGGGSGSQGTTGSTGSGGGSGSQGTTGTTGTSGTTGSGGGTTPTTDANYIVLSNTTSTGQTQLSYVAIDVSNITSSGAAGALDHDAGTVSNGFLTGTINAARTRITLSNGATANLTDPSGTLHSRVFSTSGLTGDVFGVVGQVTDPSDIPATGSSTYNGNVQLQADNGNATFALSGDAQITVSWNATNNVDAVFTDLNGSKNDTQSVQNVGTVTINNATSNGSSFSGGTFSTTGSDLAYTGGGTQVTDGQFLGPDATEVGGVFGLTKQSELELSGVFIAKGGKD